MGKMPRKDYNGAKDVAPNNETLKRVNTQNAPNSFQATGHHLTPDRSIPMTSANIDALKTNDRLLDVSREKFVKTVTKSTEVGQENVTLSIELIFKTEKGDQRTETYTKDQLLASKTLFIAKPELAA